MATPKQAHALVTYFGQKYKEKYGVPPMANRYASRWGFNDILEDLSDKEIREIIDYYFETRNLSGHTLEWFFWNYEKLAEAKVNRDDDAAALAAIREQTKRRTEEWRKKKSGNN